MNIYIELLLVACVVTYVVGLSGFTQSWLGWLSKFTARYNLPPVRSLRPFSCSQCMVWWCCILWCIYRNHLELPTIAASAGFAFISLTLENVFIFLREATLKVIAWLNDLL